jgi:hypothetical protein
LRILLLSLTNTFPFKSTAIPNGNENKADLATPSTDPAVPFPAIVVTTPSGVIFRTILLPESARYRFPNASMATSSGDLKVAAVPVPSADPAVPEPAKVDTIRAG